MLLIILLLPINQYQSVIKYSDFKHKKKYIYNCSNSLSYSQIYLKKVIKHLQINTENGTEGFKIKKVFWKSEGNSHVARPKEGEFTLISFCKMVNQFE